jgi:hypothetical protein
MGKESLSRLYPSNFDRRAVSTSVEIPGTAGMVLVGLSGVGVIFELFGKEGGVGVASVANVEYEVGTGKVAVNPGLRGI